jgi:uncharacterized tellurite resistance protein B-like protein
MINKGPHMIDLMKKFFEKRQMIGSTAQEPDSDHDIRIATCAIFLEIANIDGEFTEDERHLIVSILKQKYQLSDAYVAELIEAARKQLDQSLDLWHFTNLINQNYSDEERCRIVEMVWRIVYVDGRLDKHEDYLMHKLSKLLRLTHGQLIDAKLRVLNGEA